MAIVNGYCTLAELKAELSIEVADTQFDTRLENAITDASRAIDGEAGRFFYVTSSQVRHFSPTHSDRLHVGDLVTVTELALDEAGDYSYGATWDADEYALGPENAGDDGMPYWFIEPVGGAFTLARRWVRITGTFGFPTVPAAIRRACLLEATRLWRRIDAPFGITGNTDITPMRVPMMDPDVRRLIRPFRIRDLA